ncbi:type III polyketide synthase [Lutibaculum baratangense]|uniref:Chalcone synthase n=1 Tax=Lutibaculum baratangense AMV1 TaxID=631454 RepID=V4RB69_9HYPH|nr:type III polyketide synthase [Lutibaculum baratangense]ESR22654.1 Chalcone synthase [Lutibaculum baratangense AMV1]
MADAFVNRIATATPPNDVHQFFLDFARAQIGGNSMYRTLFERMAEKGGIRHRFSCIAPADDPSGPVVDVEGLFPRGSFPGTNKRMQIYEERAPQLAEAAVARLELGGDAKRVTHVIVTSCTGFSAPGLDLEIVARCGLDRSAERTIVGFMGCYAAISGLKLARHIVRSEPRSRVLLVNLELCTLHLKETKDIEQLLSFYLWGDGCAASLISAEATGIRLDSFRSFLAEDTSELMEWHVREDGFDMVLSGKVPGAIRHTLKERHGEILDGRRPEAIDLWAVHPGGRSVLDAVAKALKLDPGALSASRGVLRDYGNMSSATVMFVLKALMAQDRRGAHGCGMAFGPGLTAETMLFSTAA